MRGIYFVAAHKLILNVSKIRLRLICARASYLHRLFAKALERRGICVASDMTSGIRAATENARRTASTPALYFCSRLVSAPPICKSADDKNMHTVYGVAKRITVLDVQKARLRVLFALRLVSGTTIFKSAGKAGLLI